MHRYDTCDEPDIQEAMLACQPPPMLPPPRVPPPEVIVAFNFVNLCNQNMGPTFYSSPFGGGEVVHEELHPAQEGAMRLALACLGRYFSGYKGDKGSCNGEAGEEGGADRPQDVCRADAKGGS